MLTAREQTSATFYSVNSRRISCFIKYTSMFLIYVSTSFWRSTVGNGVFQGRYCLTIMFVSSGWFWGCLLVSTTSSIFTNVYADCCWHILIITPWSRWGEQSLRVNLSLCYDSDTPIFHHLFTWALSYTFADILTSTLLSARQNINTESRLSKC